jgi:hypothetical protein
MCSTGDEATMSTKSWVAVIPLASVAVIVKGKDPGTHSGVPDNTPADDSVTPEGSVPVSVSVIGPYPPTDVTWKGIAEAPSMNVVVLALVIVGGTSKHPSVVVSELAL